MNLHPVILCGGSGTRLWPLSREALPKQFLPILDGRSPLAACLQRAARLPGIRPPAVVANEAHRFLVGDALRGSAITGALVCLEPAGRNTAPATALMALRLLRQDPDAILLVLPADHAIDDDAAFADAVMAGLPAADQGRLVVFGIPPRWAETGYGYIECAVPPVAGNPASWEPVAGFIEKPEAEIAARLASSGRHLWNSGMFLFRADAFLGELQRLQPELAAACRTAEASLQDTPGGLRPDAQLFQRCPALSIDHAVMEHTASAAVVRAGFAWSDIGSWNALWEHAGHDDSGNAVQGDTLLQDVHDSLVSSQRRMVVALGVRDLVIVETADAVLVAARDQAQGLRDAVEQLRSGKRRESLCHLRVQRPWGWYEDVDAGERFRVKRILVEPGEKLSLQLHHHRAEHWVVVSGTARVTRGEEILLLTENQSTYIPVGMAHRLENPGRIPLQIVEIQSGAYLDEDDIVRIEDVYQRA